jgi:two-component system alkaline phosphatase synthesis response regulator PhoP
MSNSKSAVIVDDDQKIIIMTGETLSRMGFRIFSAGDGKKGLKLIKEVKPDLVICDLLLPGIHGAELCNLIRQDMSLDKTKIIAISAVYNESDYKLVMNCKADAFIEKPFDIDDFEHLVNEVIDN